MTHKHESTKEKSLIWPPFTVKKLPNTWVSEEEKGWTMLLNSLSPKAANFQQQIRDAKHQHPI
jgi:hypothetical protein